MPFTRCFYIHIACHGRAVPRTPWLGHDLGRDHWGTAVSFGAFLPIAAVPMIIVLMVAIFTVHLPNGFSSIKLMSFDPSGAHFGPPGYETDLLYIATILALRVGGAGPRERLSSGQFRTCSRPSNLAVGERSHSPLRRARTESCSGSAQNLDLGVRRYRLATVLSYLRWTGAEHDTSNKRRGE